MYKDPRFNLGFKEAVMKSIGLALFAALAIGCTSASPTSPSAMGTSMVTADSMSLEGKAGLQKVTLYFYNSDDQDLAPKTNVIGLRVHITSVVPLSPTIYDDSTDRQGNATFWIPATVREISVTTENCGTHAGETETFEPIIGKTLVLPLRTREGWIRIHETIPNGPCSLPSA
jgi:hypothetical protein